MTRHVAETRWKSDGAFRAGRYSRQYEWGFDGGAVMAGSASPLLVPVPMSDPAAIDPEEALIASVSACHMLWFLSLAQEAGHDVAAYSDKAEGEMGRIEPGKMAIRRIILRPAVTFEEPEPDEEEVSRLHHQAHEACFIANSLKTEIRVEKPAQT